MLHRSFKPAKCKTALKLAASRIKLLKNKREAQVKQLKRELAQLLESGQDQTARIRVEHVVREEKTMAAYDLVEIYCELIAARLPIIESQKNCPIDLKEAVASIIFASPRCADIPELMDVRKHFTAKYGKEFVSAAVEIRPDCGVSRLLVEKLSAKAPDGPTKLKILTAIAEEHNMKWDPKSFGEKDNKPAEDLLNGPNTFEQSSTFQVGPPNVQDSANSADMGAHNYHVPSQQYVKHDVPANSHDPDLRSSPHSQNFPHRDVGADKTMPLGASRTNPRPPGTGPGEVEHRHSYAPDQSGPPSSTQSWNMEFKDATSAAQAAAESAERASMAARAAAELSSQGRITRQQSTESLKGSSFVSRDEGPQNHTGLKIQGEQFSKDRPSGTYHKKNPEMYRDQSHGYEQDDLAGLTERFNNLKSSNNSSQTAFSKPSSAYMDDYHSMNEPQMPVRHSRNSSSELQRSSIFGETSVNQESSKSEVDFVDEVEGGMGSENVGYFEDESIRKQASSISLKFHSRTFSDDHNLFSNTYQQQSNEKTVVDDERIQRDAKEANSHDNPVVFDDSGSENDEFMFDVENKNNGRELFSSEDGQSSSHLLANANAWGPRQNMDESLGKSSSQTLFASEKHCNAFFSEDLTSDPVPSQLLPVTFDESDGSDSESEVELDASGSEVVHSSSTGIVPHSERVSARISDPTHSGNPRLIGSSLADDGILKLECKTHQQEFSHDSNTGEIFSEETHGIGANDETDSKFAYGNLYMAQTSPIDVKFSSRSNNLKDNLQASGRSSVEGNVQSYQTPIAAKDVEPIEESSLETGTELNFGVLTGGLRNKGYRRPPYSRNLPDIPSPEQATEDSSARTRQSSSSKVDISSRASDQESYNQMVHREVDKKTSLKNPVRSSDSDDSDEDLPQQKFSSSQESYSKKAAIEANEPLSTKAYFDSDNSASEEVISKNTSTRKRHPGTGFSRRTKLSPSSFDRDSFSQATMLSKSSVNAEDLVESKSSSGSSYATETQQKPQSPTRSSDYRGSFGQHRSTEQAASKRIQQSKRSSHEDSPSRSSYATGVQQSPLPQSKGSDYWASSGQRRSSEPEAPKRIPESKRSSHEDSSSRSPYAIDVQQSQLSQSKGSDYRASSGQRRSSEPEAPQRIPESKRSSREDSSSRSPYAINVQQSPLSQSKGSDYRASSGQHRSSEPAAPKPIPESKKSLREENLKSSTQQQLSNPPPKTVAAGNTGSSKTSSSHGETPSRENSINKASHVHPKLPDWDTFAERLQSIRQNLQ